MNTLRHRKKPEGYLMKKQVILFLSVLCHIHSSHAEPVINPANSGKYFYISSNANDLQKSPTLTDQNKPQEKVPSWDELLPKKPLQQQSASSTAPLAPPLQNMINTQLQQQNSTTFQQIEQPQQSNVTTLPTIINHVSGQNQSSETQVTYQAKPHQQNMENVQPQQNAISSQHSQQGTNPVVVYTTQQDGAMSTTQITEQQMQQKNAMPAAPSQQQNTTPVAQPNQQPEVSSTTFPIQ